MTRTGNLSTAGSVHFYTQLGTSRKRAVQDVDFKKRATIVTFPAGVSTVAIFGDNNVEPTEWFRAVSHKPNNGAIDDHRGIGTIIGDD